MRKLKRLIALMLAAITVFIVTAPAVSATGSDFTDIVPAAYYYEPVLWAVENNITAGTSATTFSPDETCTRSQVVTFLWRSNGEPEPTTTDCPFSDVKAGAFYYKAVLWAVENKVTAGTSATTFSPDTGCTRGQVVTFLHRAQGTPSPKTSSCQFTDVKAGDYYYNAVLWAVENEVTAGTSATTFSPESTCTRGQIVTFLYRTLKDQSTSEEEPLRITKQPKGNTISEGETVTLMVVAFGGTAPYTYQWNKDGAAIAGATSSSYETGVPGNYTCTITDARGVSVTSAVATVVIESVDPLIITSQPKGASIVDGTKATLTVAVSGGALPYSYQWYGNGIVINGANSAEYITGEAGSYTCTITDGNGKSVTTNAAVITVYGGSDKPYKINYKLVEYNVNKGDQYIGTQYIDNSENPKFFGSADSFELRDVVCLGYEFLGWFTAGGTHVTEVNAGTTHDLTLYARWQEITYDITYKLYQTPLGEITNNRYLHYTVNKGLQDLPNPTLYNYVFLGWYMDNGAEVKSIPVGTTGDIVLNAYWTSKRNLTKRVNSLGSPIVVEDSENGVIYFAYEIGTIENVPLSDAIWTIQSVAGLAQQKTQTVTTTISEEQAYSISQTIAESTVDSGTWTLAKNWNNTTQINEQWAQQNGMTVEEAQAKATTSSNTYSITDSNGGNDCTTTTDGTTALSYASTNQTNEKGSDFDVSVNGKFTKSLEVSAEAKAKLDVVEAGGGIKDTSTFEIGVGAEYSNYQKGTTNDHTGTDTTTVDTTVTSNTSTWNHAATSSNTQTASESSSVSKALSQVISNTRGYGKAYSYGGSGSETQGFSATSSESVNSSCTLTYFKSETTTTTTTYSTDGKSDGCYRLVVAGTIHVFGVVGYDVSSKSYFTYTYNVLDDKTYEFLDYSPDLNFSDYENGVIPFEVPYYVYEYVANATALTEGVLFKTNTSNHTATVIGYVGTDADVTIPSYISSGNVSYKVTSIAANAFAGKPIRAIALSEYINEIPAGAFKGCTALEEIAGRFTIIGDEAFSGCYSLKDFIVSAATTSIGANAFMGVPYVRINVLNEASALTAARALLPEANETEIFLKAKQLTQAVISAGVNAGADSITLDISEIIEADSTTISVPQIGGVEILGGGRSFVDLQITSEASETTIRDITLTSCTRTPLQLASPNITLEAISIQCPGFALLASADNVNITLVKDSSFTSANGKAVVWNNPTLISTVKENAIGALNVSGNVYVCGTIKGDTYCLDVYNGEIIYISETDFSNYIKGSYTVTFNANGGAVSQTSMTVYYGQAYGELPTPTRQYYTFAGWYTAESGGAEITKDTIFNGSADVILYAHWTPNTFAITFDANGGTVSPTSICGYCGQALGTLPTPTRTGCTFDGWYTAESGGTQVTAQTVYPTAQDVTVYAHWTPVPYTLTYTASGTGYTISVKRTSSPMAGAVTGNLSSGANIYYNDVLSVTYTPATGYSITSHGETSYTVTNNIGTDRIYANASANSYTYNIVYKSVNGTNLGSTTVTYKYGTTNTITPPAKSGYTTPASQTVAWDSTSPKTITFTYGIASVGYTSHSGVIATSPYISYSATVQYQNRTANSVQVRVVWTSTIRAYSYTVYGQKFKAYCGSANTGEVQVAGFNAWGSSVNYDRSSTGTSGWITIPLGTTNATSFNLSIYYYQTNSNNTDMTANYGEDGLSTSWSISIPAY